MSVTFSFLQGRSFDIRIAACIAGKSRSKKHLEIYDSKVGERPGRASAELSLTY